MDDEGRYAWVESVLRRFDYRQLARPQRGPVLAYLQRLSGYSRAQITRLVSRWTGGKRLVAVDFHGDGGVRGVVTQEIDFQLTQVLAAL